MCTETPFPCACQRFRIRLVLLQLRHGRRNGVAAPGHAAVDGSDPPFWDASIGIGEAAHVHTHGTLLRGGRSRPSVPSGKATERRRERGGSTDRPRVRAPHRLDRRRHLAARLALRESFGECHTRCCATQPHQVLVVKTEAFTLRAR